MTIYSIIKAMTPFCVTGVPGQHTKNAPLCFESIISFDSVRSRFLRQSAIDIAKLTHEIMLCWVKQPKAFQQILKKPDSLKVSLHFQGLRKLDFKQKFKGPQINWLNPPYHKYIFCWSWIGNRKFTFGPMIRLGKRRTKALLNNFDEQFVFTEAISFWNFLLSQNILSGFLLIWISFGNFLGINFALCLGVEFDLE